eukprot:3098293-Heterocapsa_arctica.AAC.1
MFNARAPWGSSPSFLVVPPLCIRGRRALPVWGTGSECLSRSATGAGRRRERGKSQRREQWAESAERVERGLPEPANRLLGKQAQNQLPSGVARWMLGPCSFG